MRGITAAVVLVLAGCTSDEEGALEPSLTLGTGDAAFETLEDGDDIDVIHGPQGGYHVLGSLRVQGIDPGNPDDLSDPTNPTTAFEVWLDDTQIDLGLEYVQGLRATAGDDQVYEMIGRLLIVETDIGRGLDGDPIEVTVTVTDHEGTTLTDTRSVVAVQHPLNR